MIQIGVAELLPNRNQNKSTHHVPHKVISRTSFCGPKKSVMLQFGVEGKFAEGVPQSSSHSVEPGASEDASTEGGTWPRWYRI